MSEIEEVMIDSEDDPELEEKLERIKELAQKRDLASTEEIFQLIKEQQDEHVIWTLVEDLPVLSLPEVAKKALMNIFHTIERGDYSPNSIVIEKLEDYWDEEVEAFLLDNIQDPDEMVRVAICELLGRGESQAGIGALRMLLQDEEWLVRGYAAQALGDIGNQEQKTFLQQCLQSEESDWVQVNLYEALCQLGERQYYTSLLDLLDSPSYHTRIICTSALVELVEKQDVELILKRFRQRLLIEDAYSVECHLQDKIAYLEETFYGN
ncbi:HEAT repeat domain-containing protein [Risungbinella massiliensis]|uniref:HEAT repeat domain-containing protein n=1 Tax=Risungbinella massiliensis TaxID=1329796 RepID=UPI0005CB82B5|nr:HEAT repeat domain-containing protein [Risungbinella massiliensis]